MVGRNRPTGGIQAHGGERQRVHAGCTWRQQRCTGREGILAAAQALLQAAVVPGHRGRCRSRSAGRRRDGAAHLVPRPASPPGGPRLRPGDLWCQPAARGPWHGRAEDGRPHHRTRAAPAARAPAGADTGGPRAGPPRCAQAGTVPSGTVAPAQPGHMDTPPPPSPSPSPSPPRSRWMTAAQGTMARPGGSARPGEPRQHAYLVAPGGLGLAERLVGGTDQFGQCPPGPVQHRDADGDRQPEHEPGL